MMSEMNERYFVKCPYNLAKRYLADHLSERVNTSRPSVLTLHAPLAGGDVEQDVLVTFAGGTDPMHFDQPWQVHWTPAHGGPYPDFDGELTVRNDEDYTSAVLELVGKYEPPGGSLGKAFDHLVGSRIASATAQALLAEIATSMEARYVSDELAKTESAECEKPRKGEAPAIP